MDAVEIREGIGADTPDTAPAGGSRFVCEVVKVELEPHTNADTLSIAHVLGWSCVVRTADFVEVTEDGSTRVKTDRGVYIPIDALVPQERLAAWGLEGKLAGKGRDRVKTIRLRGVLSQGLLIPVSRWDGFEIGDDVTAQWGVTKYEPPAPEVMGGKTKRWPSGLARFDVERAEDHPDLVAEMIAAGEEVVATEKAEGTNAAFDLRRLASGEWDFTVCSRGLAFDPDAPENESNLYCQVARRYAIGAKLRELVGGGELAALGAIEDLRSITLRGEVVGGKVQANIYRLPALDLRAFDIEANDRPLPYAELVAIADRMDVPRVPELYRGPFPADWRERSYGKSRIGGDTLREGAVWKPLAERFDQRIGRVMVKAVDPEYLARQKD